ncbi:MAG: hypothetical protein II831_09400 [Firmicutes bacterium]|nr:hypothetical protein [Bacillota bacterium]
MQRATNISSTRTGPETAAADAAEAAEPEEAEAAAEAAEEGKANQGPDPKALIGVFAGGAIILAALILYGKGKGGKH